MNKKTISSNLIIISFLMTLLATFFWEINIFWMNNYYLLDWNYLIFWIQLFLYQFIHSWFLHLISNSIILFILWNQLEFIIWKKRFFILFILNSIFVAICLLLFSSWTTVWISWFWMAILTCLMMFYKQINQQEFKWALVFVVINILIGLWPNVSLTWHLSWAIFWILFFYLLKLTENWKNICKNIKK